MRFFKHVSPFKVISFDLDDTLYDNTEVIYRAEVEFSRFLQKKYSLPDYADYSFWAQCKSRVLTTDRDFDDDVTLLRAYGIMAGMYNLGHEIELEEALELVDTFVKIRSDIKISDEVMSLLNDLRQHYELVAMSNGNVSLEHLGLDGIFTMNVRPCYKKLKRKPHSDMFNHLSESLNVPLREIMHVGDEPYSDVKGAVLANCQCAFLDRGYAKKLKGLESISNLPNVVLDNIFELRNFI